MERPCFGARYDSVAKEYRVDPWIERACPTYAAVKEEVREPQEAAKAEVVIRIFGPAKVQEPCEEECVVETVDLDAEILQNLFKRKYGDKVRVEGIDIASEEASKYPEVKRLRQGGAQLVVMINDEVKFIGSIPIPLIKMEIEKRGVKKLSP
jgi:Na+-translocating ferredoxin:NAD+ oxidoreductase RnfG subunit